MPTPSINRTDVDWDLMYEYARIMSDPTGFIRFSLRDEETDVEPTDITFEDVKRLLSRTRS